MDRRTFFGSLAALIAAPGLLSLLPSVPRSRVIWKAIRTSIDERGCTVVQRGIAIFIANGDASISLFRESFSLKTPIPGFYRDRANWIVNPERDQQGRQIGSRVLLSETFIEIARDAPNA